LVMNRICTPGFGLCAACDATLAKTSSNDPS
jgi:hypothetical protein